MKLKELFQDCDEGDTISQIFDMKGSRNALSDIDISGIAYDSRNVREGYLFVAIIGEKFDGHDFIRDISDKGATVAVGERDLSEIAHTDDIMYIRVANSRKTLSCIANNFYGIPSKNLILIGITGTNGKTTTAHIIRSILRSWEKRVGLIGTIQYLINDRIYPAVHTTPESLEFQGLLKDMLVSGCTYVVSEISSHALAQFRVEGAHFRIAVFTNLTRDHLDFHGDMENYFKAKEMLFRELLDEDGIAIINNDDPYGKRLIYSLRSQYQSRKILTFGLESGADILASEIDNSIPGLRFKITFDGKYYTVSSHLIGLPNVYNIMSSVAVSISLGVPLDVLLRSLLEMENVTGRFEKIDAGQDFLCILDYAHTEDALERLILTARELITHYSQYSIRISSPRVITVFGCGGDRDHGKRPSMGAVATRLSDIVIITSDNPRSEEPADIIKEIEKGAIRKNYVIEPDRITAIRKAVRMAHEDDIVLIAGKGHENYQEIKGQRYKLSDREVLIDAIQELRVKNPK
jgi:UDP-N-acetylmuramoyl-L-alanyl-D-glutamate--2,6-diaminopimelate ligase